MRKLAHGELLKAYRGTRDGTFKRLSVGIIVASLLLVGSQSPSQAQSEGYECGYKSPDEWQADVDAAVAAGLIEDPRWRPLPAVSSSRPEDQFLALATYSPTVTCKDIFPCEDTNGLLLTDFTDGELFDFMAGCANDVMAAHGDNFDFTGYFVNFVPDHQIGAAFYLPIENDVSGIGLGLFQGRAGLGLAGNNIEGFVQMWRESFWSPGSSFTQLILGQEFEHRFAMFLDPISGGRDMQGDDSSCGRGAHWNFRVDGQGSCMEIREWVGASPAVRQGGTVSFNTDTGGVFSFTDLYLMGYQSPAQMDAGNSELRYMDDNATCTTPYNGAISDFTSADIIAANGARNPSSATAQKAFRTAWIMIHQPGSPPTEPQQQNVVGILNEWSDTWDFGTLALGSMDNTLGLPNQSPFADAGDDQTVECVSQATTPVLMNGSSSSDPDGDCLTFLWSAPGVSFNNPTSPTPIGQFPFGTTVVTLTVSDGIDTDMDTVIVTVEDTVAPLISAEVTPEVLWPPNHKLRDITVAITASDICDPNLQITLVSVTSSEPDDANGVGDGKTINDIQDAAVGTDDREFRLRAERQGRGDGRLYTVVYTAEDAGGNVTEDTAEVRVPDNQRNK